MGRSPRFSNGRPLRQVDALKHNEATRRNIPTGEMDRDLCRMGWI
jgi:adenine-specific DNA-methyltransferase